MIETISPNGTQTLWVGTAKGLVRFGMGIGKHLVLIPAFLMKGLNACSRPLLKRRNHSLGRYSKWILPVLREAVGRFSIQNPVWPIMMLVHFLKELCLMENGNFWQELLTGLSKFEQGKWVPFGSPQGYKIENVMNLLETTSPDGRHTLWIGTTNGLFKYREGRWTYYR
jgi:ligand-binding sensor domain-containing protein